MTLKLNRYTRTYPGSKLSLLLAAGLVFALSLGGSAQEQSASSAAVQAGVLVSTSPLFQGESHPFVLELSQGSHGSEIRLLYSLRWNGGDLNGFAPGIFRRLISPVDTFHWISRSVRQDPVFRLYGVRIRPHDLLWERPKAGPAAAAAPGAPGDAPVPPARRRLSLLPFLADLKDDLRRDGLSDGIDLLIPDSQGLTFDDKKRMVEGIALMNRQQRLPGLGLPGWGAELLLHGSTPTASSPLSSDWYQPHDPEK